MQTMDSIFNFGQHHTCATPLNCAGGRSKRQECLMTFWNIGGLLEDIVSAHTQNIIVHLGISFQ